MTVDSLSPADGIISEPSGFGHGLASFSTQEADCTHTIDGRHRGTPQLDSFDLSPASDGAQFSAAHGDFLGSARNRPGSQYGETLTPLSESLGMQSSGLLPEIAVEDSARRHGSSADNDGLGTRFTQMEGRNSRIAPSVGHGATRKRPREVATEGHRGTANARPHPPTHRLESSWPLDRAGMREGGSQEDESWGGSAQLKSPLLVPDQPSNSHGGEARDFREQESESVGSRSTGLRPAIYSSRDRAMASSRRWNRRGGTQDLNHGDDNQYASDGSSDRSDVGGVCSTEDASSRDGGSMGRNDGRWSGLGLHDTLSVSDVSSGGVPPPPVIPSGPLPAIATVREVGLSEKTRVWLPLVSMSRSVKLALVMTAPRGSACVSGYSRLLLEV